MFFAPSNSLGQPKFWSVVYQRPVTISKSLSRCQASVRNLQRPQKAQISTWRTWMFFAPSKSRWRANIQILGVSNTSEHIQIKIKMPNFSQEPPASSKAPNEDFKYTYVLCTFKIKIVSQNLDHGCTKDHLPYSNKKQDAKPQSGTSSIPQSPKSEMILVFFAPSKSRPRVT